jgi:hypothetical protein
VINVPHTWPWTGEWVMLLDTWASSSRKSQGGKEACWLELSIWVSIPRQGGVWNWASWMVTALNPLFNPMVYVYKQVTGAICLSLSKWNIKLEDWVEKGWKNSLWTNQSSHCTPWVGKSMGFKSGRVLSDSLSVLSNLNCYLSCPISSHQTPTKQPSLELLFLYRTFPASPQQLPLYIVFLPGCTWSIQKAEDQRLEESTNRIESSLQ